MARCSDIAKTFSAWAITLSLLRCAIGSDALPTKLQYLPDLQLDERSSRRHEPNFEHSGPRHSSGVRQQSLQPPVVLEFRNPVNGSTVSGTTVELEFALRTAHSNGGAGGGGRALNHEEINDLAKDVGVVMCFELLGSRKPPSCAPLQLTSVSIHNALQATWHTIKATLYRKPAGTAKLLASGVGDSETESLSFAQDQVYADAGDTVTVFVNLEGYPELPMCGGSSCLDSSDVRSAYFDQIYRRRNWRDGDSLSGSGSDVHATSAIRAGLEKVLDAYGVTSMLDAPCGDLSWMPLVDGIEKVRYVGADISPTLVAANKRKFAQENEDSGRREAVGGEGGLKNPVFVVADLVEGVPTDQGGQPVDLIFVRDLMLHLPPRHNLRVLRNIEASGARLFMTSTFLDTDENFSADTFVPANGHLINLAKAPYCLRPPTAFFDDFGTGRSGQRMALWELDPARPLVLGGDCGRTPWSSL